MRASPSPLRLPLVGLLLACATSERSAAPERAREASAAAPAAPTAVPAAAPAQSTGSARNAAGQTIAPDEVSRADRARVDQLARKAQPLVDAFLNSEALLTRDGQKVVLVSNRDGLPQLYVADAARPESPARRLMESLFVCAGANDPRVPRSESDLIVRALRARKVPVEYMVAENEGHSLSRKENIVQFLARSGRFLEQHAGSAAATTASAR